MRHSTFFVHWLELSEVSIENFGLDYAPPQNVVLISHELVLMSSQNVLRKDVWEHGGKDVRLIDIDVGFGIRYHFPEYWPHIDDRIIVRFP